MKIYIEIDCETINEFIGHLQMITKQVYQKADKLKLDYQAELPPLEFHHDNCYGDHFVKVIEGSPAAPEVAQFKCTYPDCKCSAHCLEYFKR